MRKSLVFFIAIGLCSSNVLEAATVTYEFTGTVSFAASPVYGTSVPAKAAVSGQFSYDTASKATHSVANGSGYQQLIPLGLQAKIGGITLTAGELLIQVLNDVPQPGGSVADILTIGFSSGYNPPLSVPLIVNGDAKSIGLFQLNLMGNSTVFGGSALPAEIKLLDFPSRTSLFADTPTGLVDVLFTVDTLVQVPEPTSFCLICIGASVVFFGRRQFSNRF